MNTITLEKAKKIALSINAYGGKPDFDLLVKHVMRKTGATPPEVATVVEFLQELGFGTLKIDDETLPADGESFKSQLAAFVDSPMDLGRELQYNYGVAKTLLAVILDRADVPDNEEVRKTLREISRFSESMLKMQERVYNMQQIQEFQEKVLDMLTPEQATLLLEVEL